MIRLIQYAQFFLLVCIYCFLTNVYALHTLQVIQLVTVNNVPRVAIDFSEMPHYKSFHLASPNRFVIDFDDSVKSSTLSYPDLKKTSIMHIRLGKHSHNRLRVVFDLKPDAKAHCYAYTGTTSAPQRLLITISEKEQKQKLLNKKNTQISKTISTIKKPKHIEKKTNTKKTVNLEKKQTQKIVKAVKKIVVAAVNKPVIKKRIKPILTDIMRKKARDIVVVIDPGHGGKDPGATGIGGIHEKDIVLAISKYLYNDLKNQPGVQVNLTRSDDRYLTLRQRLNFARKAKADIFIAIHADAYKDPKSHGASVFALSERGASSEAARWLAEKENYSELGGVQLKNKSDMLRSVLIDLSQTATIGASLQLGDEVMNYLGKITLLHRGLVEQARFVVLKSPDIPSILVETGFLSNSYEAKHLRTPYFQKQIAQAIMQGVCSYFLEKPPHGSRLALLRSSAKTYRVFKKESLRSIAKKYKTTVEIIRMTNLLTDDKLHVGQVLAIPHQKMEGDVA